MNITRGNSYEDSVSKRSKHYHCQQRDELDCKERRITQEKTKETREGVSRRVAVEDEEMCKKWQGERIGYRSGAEVCGVVAAHWSVIEHDGTWCSRCMQLESAKRLVEAVLSNIAGRLNIIEHRPATCEPMMIRIRDADMHMCTKMLRILRIDASSLNKITYAITQYPSIARPCVCP